MEQSFKSSFHPLLSALSLSRPYCIPILSLATFASHLSAGSL